MGSKSNASINSKSLRKYINKLYKYLLSTSGSIEDDSIKRIIQFISFLAVGAGVIGVSVAIILNSSEVYALCAGMVVVIFGTNLIIATFGTARKSKLFYAFITPLWYVLAIVLVGPGFAEGAACMTNLGFVYIFFRNEKLKWPLLIYNALLTTVAFLFTDFFGSIYEVNELPLASTINLLTSSIWLFLIFQIYSNEKEFLINDLRTKNDQLNVTTGELEQFTYIASHDLKTPLRNVSSFLDIIEKKVKNKEYDELLEDVQFAKQGSRQMYSLVSEILEMTKVRHELNTGYENTVLHKVIEKVSIEALKLYPEAVIENRLSQNYMANEAHFYILFQNLVLNGIKYNTSKNPQIELWDKRQKNSLEIYIKDNGIGIEEEFHEQIFEFFKRLHSNFQYEGTGLGLGLCKKIVESYSGKISVYSKVGEGSTFRVSLPI